MKFRQYLLREGTWSLPFDEVKARKLEKLMEKPIPSRKAPRMLYDLLGDDDLNDAIDSWEEDNADVRMLIADKVEEIINKYRSHPGMFASKMNHSVEKILRNIVKKGKSIMRSKI